MSRHNIKMLIIAMVSVVTVAFLAQLNLDKLSLLANNQMFLRYVLGYETGFSFTIPFVGEVSFPNTLSESWFIPNFTTKEEPIPPIVIEESLDIGIKNQTGKHVDLDAMVENPYNLGIELNSLEPQVLILHTHATESYTKVNGQHYEESSERRTTNNDYNITAVGTLLMNSLNDVGINTIQSKNQHDYPSYTGSYSRSYETATEYLEKYPSIKMVIDLHRDAIVTENGYHTPFSTEINGTNYAQIMMVVGSNANGEEHNTYMTNMNVAANIHYMLDEKYPDIMRDILFSASRYNQHLSQGWLLIEMGTSGNTLDDAFNSAELLADVIIEYIGD